MTSLTPEYLKERFDFNLKERVRGKTTSSGRTISDVLEQIYQDVCVKAMGLDIRLRSPEDVEAGLDSPQKKDWFLQAQAYQLIYQFGNGKNSLILDENFNPASKAFDWCADTLRLLRVLGFNRPTLFTAR